MNDTLNFPKGEFTHTELAQANGKTNQQVWTAYQAAIKAGVIVSAGLRPNPSGKGKPSKIWKVADGQPVPLVDKVVVATVVPAIQSHPRVNREVKPVKIVAPTEENITLTVEQTLAKVQPTVAPVVETVEVVEVIQPAPVVRNLTCQVVEIEQTCPFCSTKLLSVDMGGSVKVWCPVNDLKICTCSENPYGVSNTVKNAVEILHDKFFKHRSPSK